ncbi:MAG: hypothetical protein JNJ83_00325 [Verrucomicrobiaceae bacterium]|nr:hypothetical protein [Verrucomicrobiaceae bacterium]
MLQTLKKNWYFLVPAVLVAVPLLITVYISTKYNYSMGDAWVVFQTSTKAKTKFQSQKYTERGFAKVQPGMTGRDVFEILGVPLERHDDDTRWHYSLPVSGAGYYHERTIILQPGTGKVASVINRYRTPESPKQ